jgi:putative membrane protein
MMWYEGGGMHWWGWLVGAIMMVVFWGLIIWGIWFLVTNLTHQGNKTPPPAANAREILDARLARGEIRADEYDRLRNLMEAPPGTQADC